MLKYKHIVVEGNIGAGKTTLARFLASKFRGSLLLEEFEENDFLKDFYQNKDFALHAEVQFVLDRSKQLFQFHSKSHDIVFTDFLPDKSLLFAKMNLSDKDYLLVEELMTALFKKLPVPDLILYLNRPLYQLEENIRNRGRSYEMDISPEYLNQLDKAYENFLAFKTDLPILHINAEDIDLQQPERLFSAFQTLFQTSFANDQRTIHLKSMMNTALEQK